MYLGEKPGNQGFATIIGKSECRFVNLKRDLRITNQALCVLELHLKC